MVEKATEIGVDEISFLHCVFSERKILKMPRLDKIVVSAVKQSHKAWKPVIREMEPLSHFIESPREGAKFIAHCYEEIPRTYLYDELRQLDAAEDATVMIGPEGDFSIDEVEAAIQQGYKSVHLGKSRLRTETAGLSAVMMMQLSKE
jgi:16S rRNA (uracil1498-N3)-methyltransferase